ncbi:hypothetical protein FB567DRAFT_596019 [Paraphoma chrysanthemicola]|uniref:Uncharacterized protein n=1 Tax=Paraphoma chrysanthemicola TaxID=798071 RepID=A0A8K0R0V1_9PLEO|nr:hypothetical protein FB567DRAFT_596019 [Paraphoma chrysanthemicola]
MAPTSHRLQTPRPNTAGYSPLPPYSDHEDSTFANNLLCPRYAENDPTSAPPSPASIESFDVLDSIPWRQSYISIDSGHEGTRLRRQWAKYRTRIFAVLLLLVLLVTGCAVSTYLALAHYQSKT